MKKILNISLLLLVLCVSGSLSCRSLFRPRQQKVKTPPRAAVPGLSSSDFFRAETPGTEIQRIETPRTQVAGAAEPGLVASDFFRTETQRAAAMTQAQPIPSPTRTVPGPGPTGLVAVSAPGSTVISRTYPWPECGIVQLDKIMPNEIGLNRSFNYTIKLTNLTESKLTDIVITDVVFIIIFII